MSTVGIRASGSRFRIFLSIAATASAAWWISLSPQAQAGCPNPPVVTVSSPVVPADVCIPDGFSGNPIDFFDDFSWRSFVGMVWPAERGQRGKADTTKRVSDAGTRVFETYKSDWEVFRPKGADPKAWNEIEQENPCGAGPVGFDDVVLASFSKFGNFGQAGVGELIHAVPAQNKTWLRYLSGFDRTAFEQILRDKLYLRDELNKRKPVGFANGAVDVKSAWIDMANVARPDRYYTRTALAFDPVQETCARKTVGLVGFHIVQRTPSRPQWIWSSFEHVDNVPPAPAGTQFALNDGSGKPMPTRDPNGEFPPISWANPVTYNVDRVKPVHKSTEETNTKYQKAIGGPWQFYKLVVTQWPLQLNPPKPIPPTQTGAPKLTFPGLGSDSTSFANTALETWLQGRVTTGCMACHTATQATDFVWALEIHAFDPMSTRNFRDLRRSDAPRKLTPALERLKAILSEAKKNPGQE